MFAFSISVHYLCDAFHIYYLFCKTATMYVRIWSRNLSVVGQRVCLRVTNNAIQRSLGWSFSQTLCKDNHFWGNLHFSFNYLFLKRFDGWNKDPCFFVSWNSWMFPNSFILVLLDFVWYCYHQFSASSFSFLIWSLYVTFGEVCFLLMLIDWSREVGVSAGTSISSTFLYSVA